MPHSALFPDLLGDDAWRQLPTAVRAMHGTTTTVHASGMADVAGAGHFPARCLRRLLGLPAPGQQQALQLTIERDGSRETWTRRFAGGQMRSVLTTSADNRQLHERLGPVTLCFELRRDGEAIDWQLHGVRLCGVPLPRALFGPVLSRSGAEDGRYAFRIDTRLPLLGQLVAYRGWLEIIPAEDRP